MWEVLAGLGLPRRWTELRARLPVPGGECGRSLYAVEQFTQALGLPFTAKEYDDEDYWPASRAEVYPDSGHRAAPGYASASHRSIWPPTGSG
jgi:hypothetical protein